MSKEAVTELRTTELRTKEQILKDIGSLIEDMVEKIANNVDLTGEKASFSIKCELIPENEGQIFEISGKTNLKTPKIIRSAQILGGGND
ncbi:MAG: hypothetical protein SV062_07430 [Thermodesulfobacteriota bacterium]|nr:hypothetical protein [Thermodesulfobacteriota bacterium]